MPPDPLGVVIDSLLCDPDELLDQPSTVQNFLRSVKLHDECKFACYLTSFCERFNIFVSFIIQR